MEFTQYQEATFESPFHNRADIHKIFEENPDLLKYLISTIAFRESITKKPQYFAYPPTTVSSIGGAVFTSVNIASILPDIRTNPQQQKKKQFKLDKNRGRSIKQR